LFDDVQIFLISGIAAALSPQWLENVIILIKEAKKRNIEVIFDVNFRAKLWTADECGEALGKILPLIDGLSAGVKDAKYLLKLPNIDLNNLADAYEKMHKAFPNIKYFFSTTRNVISSDHNELTGNYWIDGDLIHSKTHVINPIVDRIGGGDAFAAGMIYGIYNELTPLETIEFATAASHLKHTVLGDMNQFTASEVRNFMDSGADVSR
jgi:2-dehydro-3-deoxygluconokinase